MSAHLHHQPGHLGWFASVGYPAGDTSIVATSRIPRVNIYLPNQVEV